MVAKTFPCTHKRKGEPTNFENSIYKGILSKGILSEVYYESEYSKIHTIRSNYENWKRKIDEVNEGKAELVLKQWEGRPYHSKQIELITFDHTSGIGVEKLVFSEKIMTPFIPIRKKDGSIYTPNISTLDVLSKNDGLSINDFQEWFKPYDLTEPMAIIHFTNFRYK